MFNIDFQIDVFCTSEIPITNNTNVQKPRTTSEKVVR